MTITNKNQIHSIRKNNGLKVFGKSGEEADARFNKSPEDENSHPKDLDQDAFKKMRQVRWPSTESTTKQIKKENPIAKKSKEKK